MNTFSRLFFAATAFALFAAPVLAEDNDDLLRPMIVRPTETTASAATQEPAYVPAPAPSASETTMLSQAAAPADPEAKLKLPPTPKATKGASLTPASARTIATAPAGRNLFADFGPPSGSVISDRVFQLRDEAVALRTNIDKNTADFNDLRGKGASGAIQYHSTVAAITARLEAGTTRGNPVLLRQWSEAEQSLNEVNLSISRLNALQTDLSANAAMSAYLLQAVRATFELSGAVEEDHVQLAMVRDEVSQGTAQIDRMRADLVEDIQRQTNYLSMERQNLQVLALGIDRGELLHNSLAGRSVVVATPTANTMPGTTTDYSGYPSLAQTPDDDTVYAPPPSAAPTKPVQKSTLPSRKQSGTAKGASAEPASPVAATPVVAESLGQLLVLVRFNQEDVSYEQQLYQAVSDALDRKPDAAFTVVAVAPKSSDPASIGGDTESAQRHADAVKNSLVQLGLQPSRISMSNISSQAAQSPEVHLYIR